MSKTNIFNHKFHTFEKKILIFMLISTIFTSILYAKEEIQFSISKTTQISLPKKDTEESPSFFLENADYNNLYNINFLLGAFTLKGSVKAPFLFYPHVFPHAFQQGFTQAFPQTVENYTQNMLWTTGISYNKSFDNLEICGKLGVLDTKGGLALLKKPYFSPAPAICSQPSFEYGTKSSIKTTPTQSKKYSASLEFSFSNPLVPDFTAGINNETETYLSIYKHYPAKKSDPFWIRDAGWTATCAVTKHGGKESKSWTTETPFYPEKLYHGFTASIFLRTSHTSITCTGGLNENPFNSPFFWGRGIFYLDAGSFSLYSAAFIGPQNLITSSGTNGHTVFQAKINPSLCIKKGETTFKTGILYETDLSFLKKAQAYETDQTAKIQFTLEKDPFSLTVKDSFQITPKEEKWKNTATCTFQNKFLSNRNSATLSWTFDQNKKSVFTLTETFSPGGSLIDNAGADADWNVKSDGSVECSIKMWMGFEGGNRYLKWKAKGEFSAIF